MKYFCLLISMLLLSINSFAAQPDKASASVLDEIAAWQTKHPLPLPSAHAKKCVFYYAGKDLALMPVQTGYTIV